MNLQQAILQGNLAEVRRILIENPACIDEKPELLFTELLDTGCPVAKEHDSGVSSNKPDGLWLPYLAARCGQLDIVKYIVEYSRASFNETDENCRTMLHYGVESGNPELVKYLVERVGLSPLAGDKNLVTPYELARKLLVAVMGYKEEEFVEESNREGVIKLWEKEKPKLSKQERGFAQGYVDILDYFEKHCGFSLENSYKNPILTGMHPDPSIVCVGEDFYMVNSSFVFFPCIPISHSRDLIHWEVIGHAITNPEWSGLGHLEGGRGYWAPDISYYDGKFYITATYRQNDTVEDVDSYAWNATPYRRQMVVSSEHPEGPYCEPSFIDEDGIDPSIFTDDDGKRYMLLNRGARVFEISPDGKKQLSEAKLLYYGHNKRAPEGSHLLKKDGWYYLFQAEGGTGMGHRISVARSRELFGMYEPCPFNPIMRQEDPKQAIQRCGHGKPVCTPNGEWYMVYLCGRQIDGKWSMLGRETALDKITWTQDGWPMVNNLQGPSVLAKKPELPEACEVQDSLRKNALVQETGKKCCATWNHSIATVPEQISRDGLAQGLAPSWVTVREPEENFAEVREEGVYLLGSKADLCEVSARNMLLQRQIAFNFIAETRLSFATLSDGQDAGMTCYYDENTYLKFGVFVEGDTEQTQSGKVYLKVQEHVDNDTWDSFCVELGRKVALSKEIALRCETKGLERTFSYRFVSDSGNNKLSWQDGVLDEGGTAGEDWKVFGTLPNVYYLCDEGIKRGKRFTGAMVGVYVHGETRVPVRYFKMS